MTCASNSEQIGDCHRQMKVIGMLFYKVDGQMKDNIVNFKEYAGLMLEF